MDKLNANVFVKVAALGSYRKAADDLGYTQAGISYIINSMEDEAEMKFFIREHNGVRLTAEGEHLLPYMKQICMAETSVEEEINRLKGLETGHIRLLSFNSVIVCWLPDIIKGFKEEYPGITIDILGCENPDKAIRKILDGDVDCGFLDAAKSDTIELVHLKTEPDVAVVALDHPMANEPVFSRNKAAEYPFIGAPREDTPEIYRMADKYGIKFNQIMTVNTDYGSFSMISKNLGYGIFPKMVVEKSMFPVKAIPLQKGSVTNIALGFKSYETISMATRAFVEFVEDFVEEQLL